MTQEVTEKPKKRSYDEETKQRALLELAACSGNARLASRRLAEDEVEISHQVLYVWMNDTHAADYQRLRADLLPKLRERAADRHAALEDRAMTIEEMTSDRIEAEIPHMKHKELIDADYKASLKAAIHTDKRLLHEGQPTSHVRTSVEIIRDLRSLGYDEVDAEVVSEESVPEIHDGSQAGVVPEAS